MESFNSMRPAALVAQSKDELACGILDGMRAYRKSDDDTVKVQFSDWHRTSYGQVSRGIVPELITKLPGQRFSQDAWIEGREHKLAETNNSPRSVELYQLTLVILDADLSLSAIAGESGIIQRNTWAIVQLLPSQGRKLGLLAPCQHPSWCRGMVGQAVFARSLPADVAARQLVTNIFQGAMVWKRHRYPLSP